MKKVTLIYWPEDGNVESIANMIKNMYDGEISVQSIVNIDKKVLSETDNWIVGGSTVGSHVWEDADDSNKWSELFKLLDKFDLSAKVVAFYGLGDQILYPNHFVNGLGVFQEEFEKRNAHIVGQWPTEGYDHTDSEGVKDDHFYGLALDEDNQEELTEERLTKWLDMIQKDFK